MRSWLSCLCVACSLAVSLTLPNVLTAYADETALTTDTLATASAEKPQFVYTIDRNGNAVITGLSDKIRDGSDVVVPASIDGHKVISATGLEGEPGGNITFPEGIEEIGFFGFNGESLYVPGSVKRIEGASGNFESIVIGEGFTSFGTSSGLFDLRHTSAVYLPSSLGKTEWTVWNWSSAFVSTCTIYIPSSLNPKMIGLHIPAENAGNADFVYVYDYTDKKGGAMEALALSYLRKNQPIPEEDKLPTLLSEGDTALKSLMAGETVLLTPIQIPLSSAKENITWAIENPSVASYERGRLKALSPGVTDITCTVGDFSKSFEVVVSGLCPLYTLAGDTRFDTMASISQEGFIEGCDTVIVASGNNFPDALAASSLAGCYECPILLTNASSLSPQAKSEIERLAPSKAIVVGGTQALSENVMNDIKKIKTVKSLKRISGNNRIETALAIYKEGSQWSDTCIIAYSQNFADALSISPYAYKTKSPIFLANRGLDNATIEAIRKDGFKKVIIVGGTAAVPDKVKDQLGNGFEFVRLSGSDRYQTSAAIAKYGVDSDVLSYRGFGAATGSSYPDALSGGSLCGANSSVLLLVDKGKNEANDLLKKNASDITWGYVFGGENAVSPETRKAIANAIGGTVQE